MKSSEDGIRSSEPRPLDPRLLDTLDSRTWRHEQGHAVRLWDPKETESITDRQAFRESLLDQTVRRLDAEPIHIYTHRRTFPRR